MKAIKISFKTKKLKINTSVWQRRGKKKKSELRSLRMSPLLRAPQKCEPTPKNAHPTP